MRHSAAPAEPLLRIFTDAVLVVSVPASRGHIVVDSPLVLSPCEFGCMYYGKKLERYTGHQRLGGSKIFAVTDSQETAQGR